MRNYFKYQLYPKCANLRVLFGHFKEMLIYLVKNVHILISLRKMLTMFDLKQK